MANSTGSLAQRTLKLLEKLNTRYVCMTCANQGGEGKHTPDCEFYAVLTDWRRHG